MNRLRVSVIDEYNHSKCAKAILYKTSGERINLYYINGHATFEISENEIVVVVACGKLYYPVKAAIQFDGDTHEELRVVMKRIIDPTTYGLYSFDAHNHVSRIYYNPESVDLARASLIAKAEDLHVLFAGTPYNYENHQEVKTGIVKSQEPYRTQYKEILEKECNESFLLDVGNEYCKYRYGHVFMLNYSEIPPVDKYRDPLYYAYELNRHITSVMEPPFSNRPIANAVLSAKEENTAAIFAHPTSWWYDSSFITNIAASLGFDILTGAIDGIVIMGYKADSKDYRDLWLELLNNGYFVTGVAETDAVMDSESFEMPPFRTYAYTETLSLNGISQAVKGGRCVVSSGPLLHFTLDGERPGSVLAHVPGKPYHATVVGTACFEGKLTKVVLLCNGSVVSETVVYEDKLELDIVIPSPEKEGYVLVYLYDEAGNMAIANPVYIRNSPFVNQGYQANVEIDVYQSQGETPATGTFQAGSYEEVHFDGKIICKIPPHQPLVIRVGEEEKIIELFYIEPVQKIMKHLYSGAFNEKREYAPGQAPVAAFAINTIRNILDSVKLSVVFNGSSTMAKSVNYHDTHVHEPVTDENPYIRLSYIDSDIPSFADFKAALPIPLWQGRDDVLCCYDRAWEIAHSKLKKPEDGSGFVSNYLYTSFSNSIFMWGLSFVSQFGRYASRSFPFINCLDNFYAKQHKDGFICRQINIYSGLDEFERFDPSSTGPNILAWAEWEDYQLSGDAKRLQRVFPALLAYHRWLRKHRTWKDGTYFSSGWGCGMDNQPRMQALYHAEFDHGHMSWLDITAQQVLSAKMIICIAEEIGRLSDTKDMQAEIRYLSDYINQNMWDDKEKFYYDRYRDGRIGKEKTIGAYWTLLADIVPPGRIDSFVAHLEEGGAFDAAHRVPTIPVHSVFFDQDGGNYWRGGVWCITNYMLLKGLKAKGYYAIAHAIAKNHVEMVTTVFRETGSIWESYDALKAAPGKCHGKYVRNEFVGFSGLAPITIFIEDVLGIIPNAEENKVVWRINLLQEHGINNYPLSKNGILQLLCYERACATEKPRIKAKSSIDTTLHVIWNGGEQIIELKGCEI